jgi:voltage-gated potassium channel
VAQAVLRPSVMDFIELATRSGHLELQIEETRIGSASALSGKTLDEARLGQALGVVVVVIRKPDGSMVVSPQGDARLAPDDILIALGRRDQLDQLEALARG